MYLAGRWPDRQLSRLELAVVVIVLSLILLLSIQQMLKLFARAESSMLATSVMNINTALQYRAAWYRLNADYAALEAMQGMNPFDLGAADPAGWLKQASGKGASRQMLTGLVDIRLPANYHGALDNTDPEEVAGGDWYFDRRTDRLVYRVNNTEYFAGDFPGPARVEFTVDIDYNDRNENNRFEPGIDEYHNIRLRAFNNYTWQ